MQINFRFHLLRLASAFLMLCEASSARGSVTFSDAEFEDADWTVVEVLDTTPNDSFTFSGTRTSSGGNPAGAIAYGIVLEQGREPIPARPGYGAQRNRLAELVVHRQGCRRHRPGRRCAAHRPLEQWITRRHRLLRVERNLWHSIDQHRRCTSILLEDGHEGSDLLAPPIAVHRDR